LQLAIQKRLIAHQPGAIDLQHFHAAKQQASIAVGALLFRFFAVWRAYRSDPFHSHLPFPPGGTRNL
jgi:hypothetical protein